MTRERQVELLTTAEPRGERNLRSLLDQTDIKAVIRNNNEICQEFRADVAFVAPASSMENRSIPDLIKDLRQRTEMLNYGNGDVRDLPDQDCVEAADALEVLFTTNDQQKSLRAAFAEALLSCLEKHPQRRNDSRVVNAIIQGLGFVTVLKTPFAPAIQISDENNALVEWDFGSNGLILQFGGHGSFKISRRGKNADYSDNNSEQRICGESIKTIRKILTSISEPETHPEI